MLAKIDCGQSALFSGNKLPENLANQKGDENKTLYNCARLRRPYGKMGGLGGSVCVMGEWSVITSFCIT